MTNYLQPEEQQLKQIDSLNLKYALRMEELKNSNGRWNKLKKARALVEEKDEKLKHILNEEQFNIYLEKRKDLQKK